jgi:hypothetical protein
MEIGAEILVAKEQIVLYTPRELSPHKVDLDAAELVDVAIGFVGIYIHVLLHDGSIRVETNDGVGEERFVVLQHSRAEVEGPIPQ